MAISKRLEKIANLVPKGARFADIGTDHGYMPIYVLEKDNTAYGVLCDLNELPLATAKKNIELKDIDNSRYKIRLGNGLGACLDIDLDIITISGMGASLMLEILTKHSEKLASLSMLILSPNLAPWLLRENLGKYGFNLIKEELVYENGLYYEILVFKREFVEALSKSEIFFGKFLPKQANVFDYFESRKINDFYRIKKMRLAKNQALVVDEINRIEDLWKGFKYG